MHVCLKERMCTDAPTAAFSSSSSCTFQAESTANKWLKVQVKYVSFFSPLSQPLLKSRAVLRAGTGFGCKVKEERITQDTLQIKVSVR